MLRRLHPDQPESFAFTPANEAWAKAQITKYPVGRQASAVIPLLWRAQEQEGWLSRPAIEHVATMLDMAYIRVLEVATFYFMFQLQPVGSVAHIQICGTTSCMICGAEDLVAVCKDKIAARPHDLSADGKFSWEEVECLGACANAPMAQIGKDYYEDLTAEKLAELIDALAAGEVPQVGPQQGRFASEPAGGLTSLTDFVNAKIQLNASAALASDLGDTVKRIDGTEVPLTAPWGTHDHANENKPTKRSTNKSASSGSKARDDKIAKAAQAAKAKPAAKPAKPAAPKPAPAKAAKPPAAKAAKPSAAKAAKPSAPKRPRKLSKPRKSGADDLKLIKGVGPKLEKLCNELGFWHFDQIAAWTAAEVSWVDDNLEGFKGRVSRDEWVSQAKILATGEETEFSNRAKKS